MKKIKCIIFDSDGVVNFLNKQFSDRFVQEFPDQIRVMDFFKNGDYAKCLIGESSVEIEFPKYLKNSGWTLDKILDYWNRGDRCENQEIIKYINDVRAKQIYVVLATNQANSRTKYMKEEMGFNKLFDQIYSSAELGVKKPDIEFYEKVFKDLNTRWKLLKSEIVYWDDNGKNIKNALKFGFDAHLYQDFTSFTKIMKTYTL